MADPELAGFAEHAKSDQDEIAGLSVICLYAKSRRLFWSAAH